MKNPCQILVEHELGTISDAQLIQWACEVLCGNHAIANDAAVVELAGLRPQVQSDFDLAGGCFRQIISRHFPDFKFQSPDGIGWAREALKQRCEAYIQRRISPGELCSVVSPVEQHFNFPKWLGNLFNACDWIDGHAKREDVPYLEEEVRKIYEAI